MDKKQIAEALSGSELPFELPHDIRVELQINNLVIAYLSSCEVHFEGSIDKDVEFEIYEDNFIYLNNRVIEKCNDNYCPHQKSLEDKAVAKIEISEHETEDRLFLKTDIPHETFKMFFSGELESVGIVFSMEDISPYSNDAQKRKFALMLSEFIHSKCENVPHDIGLTLANKIESFVSESGF